MTNDLNTYYDHDGLVRLLQLISAADRTPKPSLQVVESASGDHEALEHEIMSQLRQAS